MSYTNNEVKRKIRRSFNYLFDEHNFIFLSEAYPGGMAGWEVILVSDLLQLKIYKIRGEVYLEISPLPNEFFGDSCWINLRTVISYITGDIVVYQSLRAPEKLELQLAQLANDLRVNYDQICTLFEINTFVQLYPEFTLISERRTAKQIQTLLDKHKRRQ